MENNFKTKRVLLLASALLSFSFQIYGQVDFVRTYPTSYDKTSREVLPTPDGGYLIAGMTNTTSFFDCNAYIIKTDNMGNMLWDKIYGGSKPDYPYSMVATTDGNFLITGFTQSFGGGDMDIYLLKLDQSGNKIFEKNLGGFGNEEAREIITTSDGNYIIVGTSNSFSGSQDAFLMKIDNLGNELWRRTYGGADKEFGNGVAQCADGGFILTGQTYNGQNGEAYLVRTDASGVATWTNSYGGALNEEGIAVVANPDGSFVFAVRDSTASSDIDIRIIKTDASGVKSWEKIYGGSDKDTPKRLRATSDGGYIVGAISRSFGWFNPDMWILKLNAAGDTTWSRHFGASNHEHCHDIKESAGGGYLAVGHSRSYSPFTEIYFIKMNASGLVGVNELSGTAAFELYPNPTDGYVKISLNSEIHFTGLKISNALGQVVYSEELEAIKPNEVKTVDIKGQEPGLYFLTLADQDRRITKKIILR